MSVPISFEFFPPKTPQGIEKLRATRQALYALHPEFCSVTYGAGGSTRGGTFAAVREILAEGMDAACHFSCIGSTRTNVATQLGHLHRMGVKRLIALRGDLPSGYGLGGEFRYASDLIEFIRAQTDDQFTIYAACYPEVHPQAESPHSDLQALATKVRAGANALITQMFFNADAYFHFVDEVRSAGIEVPVIPGIMPITSSANLLRFAANCGAEIPRWLRLRLQSLGDDVTAIRALGLDVMQHLCERLVAGGAPALHFYTINQSAPTLALCARLGYAAPAAATAH